MRVHTLSKKELVQVFNRSHPVGSRICYRRTFDPHAPAFRAVTVSEAYLGFEGLTTGAALVKVSKEAEPISLDTVRRINAR